MCASKHIHLDEHACNTHLRLRATFSPWGLHAPLLELRVATRNSVVGEDELAPRLSLTFVLEKKILSPSETPKRANCSTEGTRKKLEQIQ